MFVKFKIFVKIQFSEQKIRFPYLHISDIGRSQFRTLKMKTIVYLQKTPILQN